MIPFFTGLRATLAVQIALLVLVGGVLGGCKQDDDDDDDLAPGGSSMTFTGNGTNYTARSTTYEPSLHIVTGSFQKTNTVLLAVAVTFTDFKGNGTYPFSDSTAIAFVKEIFAPIPSEDSPGWGAEDGGSGSVTVTNYNATANTFDGTFSFTAQPDPETTASGTYTVTNGRFSIR